ncbi:hypothetical protein VH571_15020 [Frondihabitans sp. 4ASC-45]|uniref:hypothetical protein n=1 Tax=Frondihabitans sp. 4ASC-45 TaxID=3111636 RepID=UPI003C204FA5
MDYTPEQQSTIDLIAAVVNLPGEGRPFGPYAGASEWEMRQLYAESWFNVGFTDPRNVSPWIENNVHDATVAFHAYRAGFRPTDPWVKRSHSSLAVRATEPLVAPGPIVALRNRARARRTWRADQADLARMAKRVQAQAQQIADFTRSLPFDAGFGATVSDVVEGAGVTVQESDVVRGYDGFATTLHQLHHRLNSLPVLVGDDRTTTRNELRCWGEIAEALTRQLGVCAPELQATIAAQLDLERQWLTTTEKHYLD